jgi:membrane protease YdiL (CAAX protease family)
MDEALDIQHDTDPAKEVPPARRIPHLGHALIYFSLNTFCIALGLIVALAAVHASSQETALQHPIAAALGQLGGYALTFAIAVPLFPLVWQRSFWQGISWTPRPVRLHWVKLALFGISLSLLAQLADSFIKSPSDSDLLQLFRTPASAWITAILGSCVPAFAEEVAFRGFLLPALATAYDWLSLDRTPAALRRWETTSDHSTGAWIFGAFISSLLFAGLHAFQIHGSYAPLAVLFVASLGFSAVRIRTQSVAASFFVHAVYDALIFAEMAVYSGGFHHLDKIT